MIIHRIGSEWRAFGARWNGYGLAMLRHQAAGLVACLVVASLLASVAPTGRAASAEPVNASDLTRVTLIGDSTMAAMAWYTYDNDDDDTDADDDIRAIIASSYDLVYSAESCRRLVNPSCRGRFGTLPQSVLPLMRTTLNGVMGEALVVMAGYDDASIATSVDAVMAEAEAQGISRVLWLTYRTTTAYILPGGMSAKNLYESHNAELAQAATRHASLRILDWNSNTAALPTWFASDGIHLTPTGAVGLAQYIKTALDAQPIGKCRASMSTTGEIDQGPGTQPAPSTDTSGFVPLVPRRALDTRDVALGGEQGKLGAGRTVTLDLTNIVPAGSRAAVLSVTAVDACRDGYLTIFACGPRPETSNINFEVGRTTAGLAISAMTGGKVCVFSSAATDVVVDVTGAFARDGQAFHPMTPTRWIDTRGAQTQLPNIVGERASREQVQVAIRGQAGVPTSATAVWVNLTVADPAAATVLLAYPGPCTQMPLASTVNARPGRSAASSTLVGLGPDGTICVAMVAGLSDIVLDVAGWFGPGPGGMYYQQRALRRLLDTRILSNVPVSVEQTVALDAVSVVNIASTETAALGYVSARPCGTTATSSLINSTPTESTANMTAVGPGVGGAMCVGSNVATHLIVDLMGAFVRV